MRKPDFNNLLRVLNRQIPHRPTLFEFFLNESLYLKLAGVAAMPSGENQHEHYSVLIHAFLKAGYDYATVSGSTFYFPAGEVHAKASMSANDGVVIADHDDFNRYTWPNPDDFDYSILETAGNVLPEGMKFMVSGPRGVLENAIRLVGYENMCMMSMDDPKLLGDVFDAVGQRMLRHYQIAGTYKSVGCMMVNDDWGFNSQTMLSPKDMRKFVIPWHQKIVRAIHESGHPAILHSCGQLDAVMDDIIDTIGYDGKHSYEDKILPVEEAYEKYGRRIAILGGIDLDFVIRSEKSQIKDRCRSMLDRTRKRGGYALGTGNSVPAYVPQDHYFAMTEVAFEMEFENEANTPCVPEKACRRMHQTITT